MPYTLSELHVIILFIFIVIAWDLKYTIHFFFHNVLLRLKITIVRQFAV